MVLTNLPPFGLFLGQMTFLSDDRHHSFLYILQRTVILLESRPYFQQSNTLIEEGER
jgi:hypothetical protein